MPATIRFPKPYLGEGEVVLPAAQYGPRYRERIRALRKELVLPGFRPGQVPAEVIMARQGESLLTDVLLTHFFEALRDTLGNRKLIGLPYYAHTPEKLHPQPPFPDYVYQVRFLTVPDQPLPLGEVRLMEYTYQPNPADVQLYKEFLRLIFGKLEPLEELPASVPAERGLIVRLLWERAEKAPLRLPWNTLIQPFPWELLTGRRLGEKFSLPVTHLVPYTDLIRLEEPDFSPLTLPSSTVELSVASAALVQPANLEEVLEQLEISPEERAEPEALWVELLHRLTERTLHRLNRRLQRQQLLKAAGVTIPEDLAYYNYLLYLRTRSGQNGHPRPYSEYKEDLAWRVFFASYAEHMPELQVSEEEMQEKLWERLKQAPNLSPEAQAWLERLENAEEERQTALRHLLQKSGDTFKESLQQARFQEWLTQRLGPSQTHPISAETLFLYLI
ncbi:MAG: hypothetical protein NZ958_03300 [Bacteroidia bacterium]|nr:hypothetical protein [Bacteroidia bacterium]MDW8088246.1 trigger factor [Bacteroidia bacterium]